MVAFLVLALSGCATGKKDEMETEEVVTIPMGQGAILPDKDVKQYTEQASRGDGEAAYKLFWHYSIGLGDGINGQKYFDRAVELEYPTALYGKAIRLWESGTADPKLVLKCLKRALELGNPDTAKLLPEVEAAAAKSK